jgi:hypothetical protein
MPNLALPFAVVGLAAGWLSDGFLANPLIGAISRPNRLTAAIVAALAGAALGGILTRRIATRNALGATRLGLFGLGVWVILAGLFAGGVVGGLEIGTMWGALTGSANGAISAVGFIPVCAVVVAYARRADRARHGSIVAESDHLAVWGVLATGLAVMTLLGTLEILAAYEREGYPQPADQLSLGMAMLCAFAIFLILVADVFAFARVRAAARADLEERDPAEARYVTDVPAVDLGLGDDVAARMERAKSAYRSTDRALGLLWGSVSAAQRALAVSLARGVLGLAIACAVIAGHRFARSRAARIEYEASRCELTLPRCAVAADLLESKSEPLPTDIERAEALRRHACNYGDRLECDVLYARAKQRGERAELPYWYIPSR